MTLHTFPDAERLIVDYLDTELPVFVDAGVGVTLGGWSRDDGRPFVVVASDGVPLLTARIVHHVTIRTVAWAKDPTTAKTVAAAVQAVLVGHPGGAVIAGIRPLTGVLPAFDEKARAHLAAATQRVSVRSTPLAAL